MNVDPYSNYGQVKMVRTRWNKAVRDRNALMDGFEGIYRRNESKALLYHPFVPPSLRQLVILRTMTGTYGCMMRGPHTDHTCASIYAKIM